MAQKGEQRKKLSRLIELGGTLQEAASGYGAPHGGRRIEACAAAFLVAGGEGILAGGPREWVFPAFFDEDGGCTYLEDGRDLGPGGHRGVPGSVLATAGAPGGQLERGLGASLAGKDSLVVIGTRSVVDRLPTLVSAPKVTPFVVLAVNEGGAGEPDAGIVLDMAEAAGWAAHREGGSISELTSTLRKAWESRSRGPALIEWTPGR